jgi:hypothetical protein
MPQSQLSWVRFQHPPNSGMWGVADEAVLNIVDKKKNMQKIPLNKSLFIYTRTGLKVTGKV